jgi:hypothetical protein
MQRQNGIGILLAACDVEGTELLGLGVGHSLASKRIEVAQDDVGVVILAIGKMALVAAAMDVLILAYSGSDPTMRLLGAEVTGLAFDTPWTRELGVHTFR